MMSEAYEALLDEMMSVPGVRGALVVAVRDGLVVDSRVHVGVRGDAVAALAASLFRRAREATANGGGTQRFVELDAEGGRIMMAGLDELALLAILENRANAGQVRLAVRRAANLLAARETRGG
jgi:predicted regulator of Ras-like GTPase activity (Roadblock/LC7/MglB family)